MENWFGTLIIKYEDGVNTEHECFENEAIESLPSFLKRDGVSGWAFVRGIRGK